MINIELVEVTSELRPAADELEAVRMTFLGRFNGEI
jgi:hypothetical protein